MGRIFNDSGKPMSTGTKVAVAVGVTAAVVGGALLYLHYKATQVEADLQAMVTPPATPALSGP